ncbi:MAG: peptidoglycan DD-metalloendopeptidase family protein [Thermaceae bacterium]
MPRYKARYTLLLTRTGGRGLSLEIPAWSLGLLLLLGVGLLWLGIHLGQKAASVQPLERRLESTSEEVRRLSLALEEERRKNQALDQRAQRLAEEFQKLKRAIEELRRRAGLSPINARPVRYRPQGGEGRPVSPEEAWAFLEGEAKGLEQALEEIRPALERTLAREAARPKGVPLPYHRGITSYFGIRRNPFGYGLEFHDGMDFSAPYGTPVRASAGGVVVRAGWMGSYGLAVEVDHGYGYRTLYGHLSRLEVRPGQRVSRGQVLGRVGSTGRSTGPHLHYSVFRKGVPMDPRTYLR